MVSGGADTMQEHLNQLRLEHSRLARSIEAIDSPGAGHDLELRRLKKKKLVLKDRIAQIELDLLPDIIA